MTRNSKPLIKKRLHDSTNNLSKVYFKRARDKVIALQFSFLRLSTTLDIVM